MTLPHAHPGLLRVLLLLIAVSIGGQPLESAVPNVPTTPGTLTEDIACASDPTQTYTAYLPSQYTPEVRWPALLVFDPRGRSVHAARIFQGAAEEYGWLILSSDNTRSDGPWEPNDRAMRAMWPELFERWSVDPHRIYAAGFSGGAMAALVLAEMTHQLAGIVGTGGRIPDGLKITETGYAHFGAAGTTDFNYGEMWRLDALLAGRGNPHRMEVFEGRHQWLPEDLATLAIEWFELDAIRRGTRQADPDLVDRLYGKELAAARRLEAEGMTLQALWRYQAMSSSFGSLRDIREVVHRVSELERDRSVLRQAKDRQRWDAWERRYEARLARGNTLIRNPEIFPTERQLAGTYGINELKRRAAGEGYEAVVARRILESIWTQTSFYLTRELMSQKRYREARTTLSVALEIRDDAIWAWYNLACAAARSGSRDRALEALERSVELGYRNLEHLTSDADLASLHDEPRFRAVIAAISGDDDSGDP